MILIIYAHTRHAGIEDYTQKSYNVQTGIEGKIVMYIVHPWVRVLSIYM